MKLRRPHIPLAIRVQVAERQLIERGIWTAKHRDDLVKTIPNMPMGTRLEHALALLFMGERCELDHEPSLGLRPYNLVTDEYTPPANDPAHLFYILKGSHRTKTFIRGPHGQFSDTALMKRERRRKRKPKPTKKIASRPFSKISRPMRGKW